jgi:hypothetical protein
VSWPSLQSWSRWIHRAAQDSSHRDVYRDAESGVGSPYAGERTRRDRLESLFSGAGHGRCGTQFARRC